MDGIVIKIPIDQVINVFSVVVLLPLVFHLWRRTKESTTPSLSAFRWFFVFVLLMMMAFALPFLVIKDLTLVQMSQNIAHFCFMVAITFLLRSITLLLGYNRRLFILYIPALISFIGATLFFWQMSVLEPSIPVDILATKSFVLFDFLNTAPIASNFISGIIGLLVFLTGTILFFVAYAQASNQILRKRSLYLGLGHLVAVVAVGANFIAGQVSVVFPFFTLAALATLISILLVYRGATLKVVRRES